MSKSNEIPFGQEKEAYIHELGQVADTRDAWGILSGLGELLATSPQISNRQKDLLAGALAYSGCLTYRRDFLQEDRDPETIDLGRSGLDLDGELQAKAIACLPIMVDPTVEHGQKIQYVVTLLNEAHMSESKGFDASDRTHETCMGHFLQMEQEAHEHREELAAILKQEGLLDDQQVFLIEQSEIQDFWQVPGYDYLLLHNTLSQYEGRSVREAFEVLQEVLYLGVGMAYRDYQRTAHNEGRWSLTKVDGKFLV